MGPIERCHKTALKQHMVITRSQVLASGLHPRALVRRIKSGAWQTLFPTTYYIGYGDPSWEARVNAACLWGGEGALASHATAATLLGFETPPSDLIHISLPRRKNPIDEIRTHYDPRLPAARKVWIGYVCATTIERTIIDLCTALDQDAISDLVADVIRKRKTDLRRLERALDSEMRGATRHRRGTSELRWVLRNRFAGGVTDSVAEDLFLKLAKRQFPEVVHHHIVRRNKMHVAELDFAFLPEKLNIEIDGDQFHADPASVQRDKERDALLGEQGWHVVRFTYWQLVEKPEWVLGVITRLLALRRNQLAV